jgi:hypothetical protein
VPRAILYTKENANMQRLRLVGPALIVAFALSAIPAAAAAAEGPEWETEGALCPVGAPAQYLSWLSCFFGINGGDYIRGWNRSNGNALGRLKAEVYAGISGQKKAGSATFAVDAGAIITIECSSATTEAAIIGGAPGRGETIITLAECHGAGKTAAECEVHSPGDEDGTITTTLDAELVYLSSGSAEKEEIEGAGKGHHLGELLTATEKSFMTIVIKKGTGTCPTPAEGEAQVEGGVVAEVIPSEKNEASATLNLPSPNIESYWTRSGGSTVKHSVALTIFGCVNANAVGEETLERGEGAKFGAWK